MITLKKVDELLAQNCEVLGSLVFARDATWSLGREVPSFAFSITHRFWTYPRSKEQEQRGEEFWRRVRERIDQRLENL